MKNWGAYIQGAIYIVAGVNHFISPKTYLAIMPPYIPAHGPMVFWSGVAEVAVGAGLLFPATRTYAAWALIALLIAVFPANVFMATSEQFASLSPYIRWGRLPIQGLLIWWAYRQT